MTSGLETRNVLQALLPAGGLPHHEAERLQNVDQQFAVHLLVVHHQNAPPHADVADALRQRQFGHQLLSMDARQEQPHFEAAALRRAAPPRCSSPPITSVSMRAMVRPRPVPPVAPTWAALPREKGSKMWLISSDAMPGPVSSMVKIAISRW